MDVLVSLGGEIFNIVVGLILLLWIICIFCWPLLLVLGLFLLARSSSKPSANGLAPVSTDQAPVYSEPLETIISLLVLVLWIVLLLYYGSLELYRCLLKRWRTQS
jgi:hypothetical protein